MPLLEIEDDVAGVGFGAGPDIGFGHERHRIARDLAEAIVATRPVRIEHPVPVLRRASGREGRQHDADK